MNETDYITQRFKDVPSVAEWMRSENNTLVEAKEMCEVAHEKQKSLLKSLSSFTTEKMAPSIVSLATSSVVLVVTAVVALISKLPKQNLPVFLAIIIPVSVMFVLLCVSSFSYFYLRRKVERYIDLTSMTCMLDTNLQAKEVENGSSKRLQSSVPVRSKVSKSSNKESKEQQSVNQKTAD